MRKELEIYKYCLIEEVTILLYMTSPSAIYLLMYTLLILRTVVVYIIHKILYSLNSGDNEHSFNKMVITVLTPKIHRIEILIHVFLLNYIIKASVSDNKNFLSKFAGLCGLRKHVIFFYF
jgi:hypothetical protein